MLRRMGEQGHSPDETEEYSDAGFKGSSKGDEPVFQDALLGEVLENGVGEREESDGMIGAMGSVVEELSLQHDMDVNRESK